MRALVPWAIAGLLWAIPYRVLDFGGHGSGVYVDPLRNPLEFLSVAKWRLATYVFAQFTGTPCEKIDWQSPGNVVLGMAIIGLVGLVLATFRREPVFRFLAAGALLSAVPVCAVDAADRVMMFIGLGGMGLVGMVVAAFARRGVELSGRSREIANSVLAMLWISAHVVMPAFAAPSRAIGFAPLHGFAQFVGGSLFGDTKPDRVLVALNVPGFVPFGLACSLYPLTLPGAKARPALR